MKQIRATQPFEINPWPTLSDAVFAMMTCLILVIIVLILSNKETIEKIIESQIKKEVYQEIIEKLPDIPIEEREDRIIITFPDRVLFDLGDLLPERAEVVANLAAGRALALSPELLDGFPNFPLEIEGYAGVRV